MIGISLTMIVSAYWNLIRATKSVIASQAGPSPNQAWVQMALDPLIKLQERLDSFYWSLPAHLALSERSLFSHSSTPEFTAYISLHTWFFQSYCDLFRICLPGVSRESVTPSFLANAPGGFVTQWQCLAVSFAWVMATTWQRLLDMKNTGALKFPGGFVPLGPTGCVSIHQCTKILLTARRYTLYAGLVDPISHEPIFIDDETIDKLCWKNVSFLDHLASVAPIVAVIQRDVKDMIETEIQSPPSGSMVRVQAPVTSNIQQDKVLSRYNVLAMSIAASSESRAPESHLSLLSSPSLVQSDNRPGSGNFSRNTNSLPSVLVTSDLPVQTDKDCGPLPMVAHSDPQQQMQQQHALINNSDNHIFTNTLGDHQWADTTAVSTSLPMNLVLDYSVTESEFDMGGELDWFLTHTLFGNR